MFFVPARIIMAMFHFCCSIVHRIARTTATVIAQIALQSCVAIKAGQQLATPLTVVAIALGPLQNPALKMPGKGGEWDRAATKQTRGYNARVFNVTGIDHSLFGCSRRLPY